MAAYPEPEARARQSFQMMAGQPQQYNSTLTSAAPPQYRNDNVYTPTVIPQPHPRVLMPTISQPAPNNETVESGVTEAHVYLALAMILSVILLFTGVGIVTLLCLLPAIVYAKKGIAAGIDGDHEMRIRHASASLCCSTVGCCVGSLGIIALFCYVILFRYVYCWYFSTTGCFANLL